MTISERDCFVATMFLFLERSLDVLPDVKNNNWHGLCVTWHNEDGAFMVYYDGRLLQSGRDFQTGESLPRHGILTLGVGVSNDDIYKYSGWLGRVNAWPYVLEHPQLAVFSSKCGVERGELVSWPQFSVQGLKGNTCPFIGKIKFKQLLYSALYFN